MRSIHLVSDVSAAEQAYSSYQCLVPNSRLLRIVARYELGLFLIVPYFFLVFNAAFITIVNKFTEMK